MTSEQPPTEYFTGIDFNPSFYKEEPITEGDGDKRYLIKTQSDATTGGRQTSTNEFATTSFHSRGFRVTASIPSYNPSGFYIIFPGLILAEIDNVGKVYGQELEIVNNTVFNTCTFSGLVTCNAQVNITAGLNV